MATADHFYPCQFVIYLYARIYIIAKAKPIQVRNLPPVQGVMSCVVIPYMYMCIIYGSNSSIRKCMRVSRRMYIQQYVKYIYTYKSIQILMVA